jgi:hypothetical protein
MIFTARLAESPTPRPNVAFLRRFATRSLKMKCNHKFIHLTPTKSVGFIAATSMNSTEKSSCPLALRFNHDQTPHNKQETGIQIQSSPTTAHSVRWTFEPVWIEMRVMIKLTFTFTEKNPPGESRRRCFDFRHPKIILQTN